MAMALTLSVARYITKLVLRQLGTGEVVRKETCDGLLFTGKKVGIVGMGNIGRHVSMMFRRAFDVEVVAYDPYMPLDSNMWPGIQHHRGHALAEVLDADAVTLHVLLTPETRGLISYKDLRTMGPTTILINAARGGIVNENDLMKGLDEGLVFGAGLDCHVQEPASQPHVVGMSHCRAATAETQIATLNAAMDLVYDYIKSLAA